MRELERKGSAASGSATQQLEPELPAALQQLDLPLSAPTLTRRQLRAGVTQVQTQLATDSSSDFQSGFDASAESRQVLEEILPVEIEPQQFKLDAATILENLPADGRVTARPAPLPPIGVRRELRQPEVDVRHEAETEMSSVDIEIPEDGFRGANYLGEPSTQSIMLEVAPEAISLPIDTGEVFSTGSISILADSTGSMSSGLDGMDLDREEAVTGVISIVDPVSARDLIDARSPLGVIPAGVLMKGWWRPWAVGLLSLSMAIAAILASITIFNALGA